MISVAIALKKRSNNQITQKARGLIEFEIQSKTKNLSLPKQSRQLLGWVLILLGEFNLPELSSSKLGTDEGANSQSFLFDLTNKTMI